MRAKHGYPKECLQSDRILSPLIPGMSKMSRRTSEKEGFLGCRWELLSAEGMEAGGGQTCFSSQIYMLQAFTQKSEARSSRSGLLGSWARVSPETRARPDCRCRWLSLARVRSVALLLVQACCPDALLAGIACMLTVSSGTLVRLRGTLDMLLAKLAESRRPH